MRRNSLLVSTIMLLAAAVAPSAAQQLVQAGSEISFTTKQMGVPVSGRFKRFTATLDFQPQRPQLAKITMSIETASVSLGSTDNEKLLGTPEWFDLKAFPTASFVSSSVRSVAANRFEASGKFTLKGVSRDIVVPFELSKSGEETAAVGGVTLHRKDFKIGTGAWDDVSLVADEVAVKFRFVLRDLAH